VILPIGDWVLHQACADFMRWRSTYGPSLGQVAVNVSAQQVIGSTFAATVERTLRETGLEPSCLQLEVTEGVFLGDATRARYVLNEIKDLGVQLSLDDFGTGYSSLTYLQRFPFDVLKISSTFISDLSGEDPSPRAIVSSVISLARALRLTVVAEGVETEEQLAQVTELGADQVQGYFLSHPLFAPDLEHRILDLSRGNVTVRLPFAVEQELVKGST
jgi:EAL domain-containing protein (putative c-di-GMP-specific phosphodiesterase class I)